MTSEALQDLRAMTEEQRRCRCIADMRDAEEFDGYEAEARRRGLEAYEIVALAEGRQRLARRAR